MLLLFLALVVVTGAGFYYFFPKAIAGAGAGASFFLKDHMLSASYTLDISSCCLSCCSFFFLF